MATFVQDSHLDMSSGSEIILLTPGKFDDFPANPKVGQIFYHRKSKISYQWDSLAWQPLNGSFLFAGSYFDDGISTAGILKNIDADAKTSTDQKTVYGLLDDFTGEVTSYRKVTTKRDGSSYTDSDISNILRKKKGSYYLLNNSGPFNADRFGLSTENTRTQNTTALQSAMRIVRDLGGGIININSGTYLLNPITIHDKVMLIGQGSGHASVYFTNVSERKGTVLLIDAGAGQDCIVFDINTSFTGMRNLSVYNDNANAINAVVNLTGVLYPILENVEISSRLHAPAGHKSYGLLLKGNLVGSPHGLWDSLYASFVNVNVITNASVGVAIGLALIGTGVASRPNAIRFFGGHFQGYNLSLLMDATATNSRSQGIAFLGTTFESYYNNEQQKLFVPMSVGMNAFKPTVDRYAIVWISIKEANQITFTGCYFENGGVPFESVDDGTNGAHQAFPMIYIGPNALQVNIANGNTLVAGVLDKGYGTTHPNKISFLDENTISAIEAVPVGTTSQIVIGTDNKQGLRVRGDHVLIGSDTDTGEKAQVTGVLKVDGLIKNVNFTTKDKSPKFLVLDESDGYYKVCQVFDGIQSVNDITVTKVGGAKLILANQNNNIEIGCFPDTVGNGVHADIKVEGVKVATLDPDLITVYQKFIMQQSLKIETPDPAINDNTAVSAEWVRFQSWIPKLTKENRNLLPPQNDSYLVYVTDNGGYYSYYKGGAWYKLADAVDA